MNLPSIAVLGGDSREVVMAQLLHRDGHHIATYGLGSRAGNNLGATDASIDPAILETRSALEAVSGCEWILCPAPGLGPQNAVYAPYAEQSIELNENLLQASGVAHGGGVILGKASVSLTELARNLGIRLYETKNDKALQARLSESVAESLLSLLVQRTDRVLREQRVLILGYGAAGSALAHRLAALGCQVTVAARRPEALAQASARGTSGVAYGKRFAAMADASVVVNTVPSPDAMPVSILKGLLPRLIIDIASPPGGTDHATAKAQSCPVIWARGLVGARAPRTAGELQYRFARRTMGLQ